MAAAAEVAAQPPVTAEVVGNAFVTQYYHILHLSPGLVHRFYQDVSKLGRPEEDGSMTITTTMQAINEKLLALNYGDFRSEIKSVDSQESFRGGINVLLTGYMTAKDNSGRYFAQSFFLAPQDRGYFVLNDMFRYLDSSPSYPAVVTEIVVLTSPEPVPENNVPASENKTPPAEEAVVGEVCNPSENGDVPIVEEEAPVAEVVDQVEDDTWMIVESSARVEELKHKALT
ncbi:nuclear transport factor 2-like [Salvia miltiorrhiza]|uniref:nuclear transport factor 2-like n=1 Tax=Salvia miltiorrhiza TaxID=226208 RepID=UPI0025AB7338|nr:nuclear transport factor 2-like [Salvia miltiorrhiza]